MQQVDCKSDLQITHAPERNDDAPKAAVEAALESRCFSSMG